MCTAYTCPAATPLKKEGVECFGDLTTCVPWKCCEADCAVAHCDAANPVLKSGGGGTNGVHTCTGVGAGATQCNPAKCCEAAAIDCAVAHCDAANPVLKSGGGGTNGVHTCTGVGAGATQCNPA